MANHQNFFALFLLTVVTLSVTINGIHAVNVYNFINRAGNSAGAARFNTAVGAKYATDTLEAATRDIWAIFKQTSAAQRRDYPTVNLILENFKKPEENYSAIASGNQIRLNANYIASFHGNVNREVTGILIHEMTHLLQWNGNGHAPWQLTEGIADYVRLKLGFIAQGWAYPGDGERWDEGYSVTARFLDYLTGYRSDFVAELNKKLRDGYSVDYFRQLLGKPVSSLWYEYKRFYGKGP